MKRQKTCREYLIFDFRERNRDKIQFYKKNCFQNNEKEFYEKIKQRKDEDINFKLACNLRKGD